MIFCNEDFIERVSSTLDVSTLATTSWKPSSLARLIQQGHSTRRAYHLRAERSLRWEARHWTGCCPRLIFLKRTSIMDISYFLCLICLGRLQPRVHLLGPAVAEASALEQVRPVRPRYEFTFYCHPSSPSLQPLFVSGKFWPLSSHILFWPAGRSPQCSSGIYRVCRRCSIRHRPQHISAHSRLPVLAPRKLAGLVRLDGGSGRQRLGPAGGGSTCDCRLGRRDTAATARCLVPGGPRRARCGSAGRGRVCGAGAPSDPGSVWSAIAASSIDVSFIHRWGQRLGCKLRRPSRSTRSLRLFRQVRHVDLVAAFEGTLVQKKKTMSWGVLYAIIWEEIFFLAYHRVNYSIR